jgi:putative phage-type endonuclease
VRVIECVQGTPEWLHVRCGRITASRMVDVMAKRKRGSEEMACRRDYRMELVCERLTARAYDHYVSPEMDRGRELEDEACAAYEVATGAMTDKIGFILHPTMDFTGSSPDRIVDEDGGLEVKCPKTATHLAWMEAGVVPEEHRDQMHWNMACAERDWWDFLSYDDRLPLGLRIFACRLPRDEKRIAEMEFEIIHFHEEIEKKRLNLSPGHIWAPIMPQLRSTEMVTVGGFDVPSDIMEMLGDPGFIP